LILLVVAPLKRWKSILLLLKTLISGFRPWIHQSNVFQEVEDRQLESVAEWLFRCLLMRGRKTNRVLDEYPASKVRFLILGKPLPSLCDYFSVVAPLIRLYSVGEEFPQRLAANRCDTPSEHLSMQIEDILHYIES
jgi:hypothetical protein